MNEIAISYYRNCQFDCRFQGDVYMMLTIEFSDGFTSLYFIFPFSINRGPKIVGMAINIVML